MSNELPSHPYAIFFRNIMGILGVFYLFHYLAGSTGYLERTSISWTRYLFYAFLFTPLLFLYQFYREPRKDTYLVPTIQKTFPFAKEQPTLITSKTYWFQKIMMIALLFYFGFMGKGVSVYSQDQESNSILSNTLPIFGFRGFYLPKENTLGYFTPKEQEQSGGKRKKQHGGSSTIPLTPTTSKLKYLYTLSYWILGAVATGFVGEFLPSIRAFTNVSWLTGLLVLLQLIFYGTPSEQEGGGILEKGWRILIGFLTKAQVFLSYILLPSATPIQPTPTSSFMMMIDPIMQYIYPLIRWVLRFLVQLNIFPGLDLPYLEQLHDQIPMNDDTSRLHVWSDFLKGSIFTKILLWVFTNLITYVILFTSGLKNVIYTITAPLLTYIIIGLIGYGWILRPHTLFDKENWLGNPLRN